MKIEHLAPYLPYGLKVQGQPTKEIVELGGLDGNIALLVGRGRLDFFDIKPILRPLSDLTKKIEHNGEKFVPKYKLPIELDENLDFETYSSAEGGYNKIDSFKIYECYQKLFEWHFDVFNLREKDLCIYYDELK